MSLLLSSLKKADQENKKSADEAQTTTPQTAAPAAEGAAPASASPSPSLTTVAPAAAPAASVDFDTLTDDTTSGRGAPAGFTPVSPTAGFTPVAAKKDGHKELVGASRVFRASDGDEKKGAGPVVKAIYGILGMALILGGGYGVIVSGVIPGLSLTSVMGLLGIQEQVQVQTTQRGPELEALGADDVVLSLPVPLVDVQADVDFAGLQVPEEDLQTAEGRRQYQERIAVIAGIVAPEEEEVEEELITPELTDLAGEEEGGSSVTNLELLGEIKTASASRTRKILLDTRTISDRVLGGAIKINKSESVDAPVGTGDGAEGAEAGALIAQSNEESVGAAGEAEPAATEESESAESGDGERIGSSLTGQERESLLGTAGDFYAAGSFAEAEAVYRNVLAKSPINIDAMRGLAVVAVATGRFQLAVATYLKILENYPNDPVALADLANLHGASGESFYSLEAALQGAIGKQPAWDGRLHFALGNLYAGEARWIDAQRAYFNAYSSEQSNPDYAYNLAVVFDYLNKPRFAVKYYREAVSSAQSSPSGFNVRDVEERIRSISK